MQNKTKVVAAFLDGRRLKGFLFDFSAVRGYFFLFPEAENELQPGTRGLMVRIAELKALFFVKDFSGKSGYVERSAVNTKGSGERVEVTFSDGETRVGYANSSEDGGLGFFFTPADPDSNNEHVFVVAGNVREIRSLPAEASAQNA